MNRLFYPFFSWIFFLGCTTSLFGNHPFSTQADTIDPVIQCPTNTTVNLQPLECDTAWNYTVTATDESGTAILILLSGIPSGGTFPIGTTVNVFLATDLAGNTATCSFSVAVSNYSQNSLTCDDLRVVQLDNDCQVTLNALSMLEAGPYGCPANYLIELDKTAPFGNGPWVAPAVNNSDNGKTYQYRVTDTQTGNKCWGNVKLEDKLPPVVTCKNFSISCLVENYTPPYLSTELGISEAIVTASDACSGDVSSSLQMVDFTIAGACDSSYTQKYLRTWTATDLSGNTGTCLQTITLTRVQLDEIVFPPDGATVCDAPNTSLVKHGIPHVLAHGKKWESAISFCNIGVGETDKWTDGPNCSGNKILERTWLAVDFCTGEEKSVVQKINVDDTKGPIIACPPNLTLTLALPAGECRGELDFPDAVVKDNCSPLQELHAFWQDTGITKTLNGSFGDFPGNNTADPDTAAIFGMTAGFPAGTTEILYTAVDSCGNIGSCTFLLTVTDTIKPVASCAGLSTVYIQSDGLRWVTASSFNLNSSDNCTPLEFRGRFSPDNPCTPPDNTYRDSLFLCCANLSDTLHLRLRVYDVPVPKKVSPTYAEGHFSECVVDLIVLDTNKLSCIPPTDISVNCDNFDPSLAAYGSVVSTSCGADSIAVQANYSQFDTACNRGTIVRTFKLYGEGGQTGECSQKVISTYVQDYFIRFPDDKIINLCDGTFFYGEPVFDNNDCELLSASYEDALFTVVPDACYKIERLWTVINWCTYDPMKTLVQVPNPNPNPVANHASNLPGPIVSSINQGSDPWKATVVKINPTDQTATDYSIFWSAQSNGYQYKQIIKITDTQVPTITNNSANSTFQDSTTNDALIWNGPNFWNPTVEVNDLCERSVDLSIIATDACSGANVDIEYLLFLDLNNDGLQETVVNSLNLPGYNNINYGNATNPNYTGGSPSTFDLRPVAPNKKWGFALERKTSGNQATGSLRFNTFANPDSFIAPVLPHGTHRIRWTVTDACGNQLNSDRTFIIRDGKPPLVICDSGISVNIQANQTVVVQASNLVQSVEDNCTPEPKIKIGIRKAGTGTGFPVDPDGSPTESVAFGCGNVGANEVELWAIDAMENSSHCNTNITVMDNSEYCLNNPVTGNISTEASDGIYNVHIELSNLPPGTPPIIFSSIYTDSSGNYTVPNAVPLSSSVIISPEKNTEPLNGVSTFDMVLISKHILGIEPFSSPYKLIAADANGSGSVTTFDVVEFRKLILGLYDFLPNNKSWRFVHKSYVFPNPANPFSPAFPETTVLSDSLGYDFIGIKIGDVNGSANPLLPFASESVEERTAGAALLRTSDILLKAGEIQTVSFTATEHWEGFQGELHFGEEVEIVGFSPESGIAAENVHLLPSRRSLRMSCETKGKPSFSLQLKPRRDGRLSELLEWNGKVLRPEAYLLKDGRLERNRLAFEFEPPREIVLYQNRPNPASGSTSIAFYLPEPAEAVLEVFDANGKTLSAKTALYEKGIHSFDFNIPENFNAGVLFYRLTTKGFSETKKMTIQ